MADSVNSKSSSDLENLLRARAILDEPKTPSGPMVNVNGMNIPHPPQFQPEPLVIGSGDVSNSMRSLMRVAPALQGRIPHVTVGPTEDVMRMLQLKSLFPRLHIQAPDYNAEDFQRLNLLGATAPKTNNITLNPSIRHMEHPWGLDETLAHETAHVMDHEHGDGPEEIQDIIQSAMRAAKVPHFQPRHAPQPAPQPPAQPTLPTIPSIDMSRFK